MKIQEAIIKVRLRSESEAVALNFSPEMGLEVYDGIVADDLNEWTDETYVGASISNLSTKLHSMTGSLCTVGLVK